MPVSTGSDEDSEADPSLVGDVELEVDVSLVPEVLGGVGGVGGAGGVTTVVEPGVTGGTTGGVTGVTGAGGFTGVPGVTGAGVMAGGTVALEVVVVLPMGVVPSFPASPQPSAQANVGKTTTGSRR